MVRSLLLVSAAAPPLSDPPCLSDYALVYFYFLGVFYCHITEQATLEEVVLRPVCFAQMRGFTADNGVFRFHHKEINKLQQILLAV